MKRTTLMVTAIAIALSASAQKKWTLTECIDYALQNNITLQQAKLQKQSATEERKQAKAALLPSLSASTNQSFGYRPWLENGVATVTNGTVNSKVNKTYYNGSYGINAQWTVWNGNQNRNQVKLGEVSEQQAELQTETTANNIQERIAQLYVQILYMNEAVEVNKQSLETSKRNEQRGKEMVEVGKMAKADLAQLTAQRAADEYTIVEAESNIANYKLQLKQLLELTGDEAFDIEMLTAGDEQALAEIPALSTVYETALGGRPEIKNAQLGLKQSDIQMNIAKAGAMPTISINGGVGTSTASMSSQNWDKQIKTNFDASVGASVSVPLFDNRKTKTAVNKARIQREQAQLELLDQQKQLYATIEGYWLDAETNQQKFKTALTTVESEQASYDLLEEQFRLGLKNIVELMTGKDRLLSSQQNKLQAKYTTILNRQLLRFYQGEKMTL
ncbi:MULTISPECIES: TolC family protein [unclassified Prevotella]|uniref:TolC family protein n=1 Tax=unclassified Prevotella TaxID=2638335 RepID=UPI000B9702C6|nr:MULTISPECIES: TolC family protein [unclassified Prevotella]MDD7172261.1 TolC family protein [Prevotella sp.]OYP40025.1 transporter [Prevotella sp. P5-50]OYP44107.1 transporter [Prevotella sp. P4-98]